MVSKNKEKLPLSIADEQKLKEPKPSLLEQSLVLSWMFLFPVLLIYLLYRFRKSYTKHSQYVYNIIHNGNSIYIISYISYDRDVWWRSVQLNI